MFRSQTPINANEPRRDSIVIASLKSGIHVQVGNASTAEAAFALHTVLDQAHSGYRRDVQGGLTAPEPGSQQRHTILGAEVGAYRVRQAHHEFGSITKVPLSRIAGLNAQGVTDAVPVSYRF
jgi:hypothetical protein